MTVADQDDADEVASRWGVQLLVLIKDTAEAMSNDQRYIEVSRNQSELAQWDELPKAIQVAIEKHWAP